MDIKKEGFLINIIKKYESIDDIKEDKLKELFPISFIEEERAVDFLKERGFIQVKKEELEDLPNRNLLLIFKKEVESGFLFAKVSILAVGDGFIEYTVK